MYCVHIWWILQKFLQLFNGPELFLTIWKIHRCLICFSPRVAFDWELHLEGSYPTVKSVQGQRKPVWSYCQAGAHAGPTEMYYSAQVHTPPGAPASCLWSWRQWDYSLGIKLSTCIIQPWNSFIYSTEFRMLMVWTFKLKFWIYYPSILEPNAYDKFFQLRFAWGHFSITRDMFPHTSECKSS